MKDKTIITAALTGAVTPKNINPYIPLTPEEIAKDAYACWKAGASIVHLHMRDEEGLGTMNKEKFKETVDLIRDYDDCDVIINCTTSGDNRASYKERMAHLSYVKPEMASYDAGSFNWMPGGIFENGPDFLEELGILMGKENIKPEFEIFDSGMLGNIEYYANKEVLKPPFHYQFCLGVLGAMDATVENLLYLVDKIPKNSTWSAFGVGKNHLKILYATIALGGNVRVGLEDNVYYSKGVPATNVSLVKRAVRLIKEFGKEPASPTEAREILNLKSLKK